MENSNTANTQPTYRESQSSKCDKKDDGSLNFCRMTKEKRYIMITLWVATLCVRTFYALMGPFFAQEVRCAFKHNGTTSRECSLHSKYCTVTVLGKVCLREQH